MEIKGTPINTNYANKGIQQNKAAEPPKTLGEPAVTTTWKEGAKPPEFTFRCPETIISFDGKEIEKPYMPSTDPQKPSSDDGCGNWFRFKSGLPSPSKDGGFGDWIKKEGELGQPYPPKPEPPKDGGFSNWIKDEVNLGQPPLIIKPTINRIELNVSF